MYVYIIYLLPFTSPAPPNLLTHHSNHMPPHPRPLAFPPPCTPHPPPSPLPTQCTPPQTTPHPPPPQYILQRMHCMPLLTRIQCLLPRPRPSRCNRRSGALPSSPRRLLSYPVPHSLIPGPPRLLHERHIPLLLQASLPRQSISQPKILDCTGHQPHARPPPAAPPPAGDYGRPRLRSADPTPKCFQQ